MRVKYQGFVLYGQKMAVQCKTYKIQTAGENCSDFTNWLFPQCGPFSKDLLDRKSKSWLFLCTKSPRQLFGSLQLSALHQGKTMHASDLLLVNSFNGHPKFMFFPLLNLPSHHTLGDDQKMIDSAS